MGTISFIWWFWEMNLGGEIGSLWCFCHIWIHIVFLWQTFAFCHLSRGFPAPTSLLSTICFFRCCHTNLKDLCATFWPQKGGLLDDLSSLEMTMMMSGGQMHCVLISRHYPLLTTTWRAATHVDNPRTNNIRRKPQTQKWYPIPPSFSSSIPIIRLKLASKKTQQLTTN